MTENFDYIVIGGGSGGIASARRAASYGAKVALLEKDRLGGTCVNLGCVPKKIMFNAAHIAQCLQDALEYGFELHGLQHDWAKLKIARDAYIARLNDIYQTNLKKEGIKIFRGYAQFINRTTVSINEYQLNAPHILIATGSRPLLPNIPGATLGLTSDDFFSLPQFPQNSVIAGAGYIAVELAGILQSLGSKTTLLLRHEKVLRHFDDTISNGVTEALELQGIQVIKNVTVESLRLEETKYKIRLSNQTSLSADAFFWAIGRKPNFTNLGLEKIGLQSNTTGHLATDDFQNTTIKGIYAVGDVTGKVELTPVAIAAGRALADRLFGGKPQAQISYENIPTVIFSHPPAGTVGLSEQKAQEIYGKDNIRVYKTKFTNMYYAPLEKKRPTYIKMVTLLPEERILGLHIVGMGADEMLQGFAVSLRLGATRHDFNSTIAIHPTAAEEVVLLK